MDVAPHPHCGLATVSWLFSGEVEHRDSLGTVAMVRPGEVNLMTAGRGISHSEVSTPSTSVLHGAQLWVVLPSSSATIEPRFEHHVPPLVDVGSGVRAQVFVGSMWGSSSPVRVETPLVGAEVVLPAGASVVLPVPDGFEVAVLVDVGSVTVGEVPVARGELGVVGAARHPGGVTVTAGSDSGEARVLVLGGEPFGEEVVMWWNFIGRSHEDVEAARAAWEAGPERFGSVPGYVGPVSRIPAPALPAVRLRPGATGRALGVRRWGGGSGAVLTPAGARARVITGAFGVILWDAGCIGHTRTAPRAPRASGGTADALASGASVRKGVGVQIPPCARRRTTPTCFSGVDPSFHTELWDLGGVADGVRDKPDSSNRLPLAHKMAMSRRKPAHCHLCRRGDAGSRNRHRRRRWLRRRVPPCAQDDRRPPVRRGGRRRVQGASAAKSGALRGIGGSRRVRAVYAPDLAKCS